MVTHEETSPRGGEICAMRHFVGVAIDLFFWELKWHTEKKLVMEDQ